MKRRKSRTTKKQRAAKLPRGSRAQKINPVRFGGQYFDVVLPEHPQIIIPDGYDLCDPDDCGKPAINQQSEIWCTGANGCNSCGCKCHLFKRARPANRNDWEHAAPQGKKVLHEPQKYDYGCLCLKKL